MKMNFIAQAVGGSAPFATLRRNLKKGMGVRLFVSPPTKRKRRPSATT